MSFQESETYEKFLKNMSKKHRQVRETIQFGKIKDIEREYTVFISKDLNRNVIFNYKVNISVYALDCQRYDWLKRLSTYNYSDYLGCFTYVIDKIIERNDAYVFQTMLKKRIFTYEILDDYWKYHVRYNPETKNKLTTKDQIFLRTFHEFDIDMDDYEDHERNDKTLIALAIENDNLPVVQLIINRIQYPKYYIMKQLLYTASPEVKLFIINSHYPVDYDNSTREERYASYDAKEYLSSNRFLNEYDTHIYVLSHIACMIYAAIEMIKSPIIEPMCVMEIMQYMSYTATPGIARPGS